MKSYALLYGSVVAEVFVPVLASDGVTMIPVEDRYHPAFIATLIDVTGNLPSAGETATHGANGWTFSAPVASTMSLSQLQTALCADIDAQAETQRLLYITPGAGQAATYLLKQTQAAQALAAQATTDAGKTPAQLAAAYPFLANEIAITVDPTSKAPATDIYGVARGIMAVLNGWQPIGLAIEAMRLKTKAAINAATTSATAEAAHDAVAWPPAAP